MWTCICPTFNDNNPHGNLIFQIRFLLVSLGSQRQHWLSANLKSSRSDGLDPTVFLYISFLNAIPACSYDW